MSPMSKREPFAAPALAAAFICFSLCVAVVRSGARASGPCIVCQSCLRPSTLVLTAAGSRGVREGQDVVGQKMPPLDFDRWLNTKNDKPLDTAGHVTLYRWWTDGCPHCEKTLPAVEKLRQKYGARGLRVVAVYHPKPPRDVSDELVRGAAKGFGYGGPVALDLDWSELKKFYLSTGERSATSASFVVDREGAIRLAHPGPRFYPSDDPADAKEDADYRAIEKAIDTLLRK